jgi:hypothetical protein
MLRAKYVNRASLTMIVLCLLGGAQALANHSGGRMTGIGG